MAESKPKKKLGRPEKLTPETQTEIVNALATGVYIETAAATAGISKNTLYDWIRKGTRLKAKEQLTEGEEKYVAFSDAVKKAMADSEMRDVCSHRSCGPDKLDCGGLASGAQVSQALGQTGVQGDRHAGRRHVCQDRFI
jgi:transposase-like protein